VANIIPPSPSAKPGGDIIKFYLPPNEQYKKGERIPININGYQYVAVVGAKQELPADVVEVLENAKSRTAVPNLEKYDPERYGTPRSQDQFFNPEMKLVYQQDFDIQRL
jgi:hypothetical protein